MRAEHASKMAPPLSPFCPSCGKEMSLIGVVPTCGNTIYEYLCSNDRGRLSWQPQSGGTDIDKHPDRD